MRGRDEREDGKRGGMKGDLVIREKHQIFLGSWHSPGGNEGMVNDAKDIGVRELAEDLHFFPSCLLSM